MTMRPTLPGIDYCLFCKADALILVATTVTLPNARGPLNNTTQTLVIPNYLYTVCEKCGFEFVTGEQSKLNDERKIYGTPSYQKSCSGYPNGEGRA